MQIGHDGLEIDESLERVDFETVHSWLTGSYWSPGISQEKVERAARGSSLVVATYDGDDIVGYLRVVSDRTTFAWVADVFVDENYRGRGIAKGMVKFALDHPDFQNLRRWILATRDAHEVYAACGFHPLPEPGRWMVRLQPSQ